MTSPFSSKIFSLFDGGSNVKSVVIDLKTRNVFCFIVALKTVQIKRKREKEKIEWLLKLKTAFIYFFIFIFFSFKIYAWQVHNVPEKNVFAQVLLAINPLGNLLMSKFLHKLCFEFCQEIFQFFLWLPEYILQKWYIKI